MSAVEIIEVAPRDGLQNQSAVLSTADKIALILKLEEAGAKRMEVASFVNPKRVPQMADAEDVLRGLKGRAGFTKIGLVLNDAGLARALQTDVDEIGVVAIASDAFGLRNQKQTSRESVEMAVRVVTAAKAAGRSAQVTIGVAFGCPFEGEVAPSHVAEMAREIARAEPREIAVADTIGVAVPRQVSRLIATLRHAVPGMTLRCHFHNTRNTGIANAWTAIESGVTLLDASAGGIGGCPFAPKASGNIATEDLLYMLGRSGIESGYDLGRLIALAPWLADRLGLAQLPAMVSRAGAFPDPQANA
jgi:hydroxymethylglutaryl-CoA lyase